MVLSSLFFIFAFLPIVLGIYFFLSKPYRSYWLVLVSLFFYTLIGEKYVYLLIFSIVTNYIFGLLIDVFNKQNPSWSKFWLAVSIFFNVGLLFAFKYLNFVTKNLNQFFPDTIYVTKILLPIGISFFTFSAISYLVDVYRKSIKVEKELVNFALYLSLFPKLTVGPIVRYDSFLKSFNQLSVTEIDFSIGLKRFIKGLSKKVILASAFAIVADKAFGLIGSDELSVSLAWYGAVSYAFQIYFDFSGYCDMAIGVSRMMGFKFAENFDYPYIAKSASEFWRRWHITLGSWFKDYIYIPLGGSRVSTFRLVINIFVVWILTGIWHGSSWNFVAWGLMYFVLIAFEKISGWPDKFEKPILEIAYQIFTLLCVLLGWVLFRANGLIAASKYMKIMLGLTGNVLYDDLTILYLNENWWFIVIAILISTPIFKWIKERYQVNSRLVIVENFFSFIFYVLLFLVSISYLVVNGHNPAVYFNF